MTQHASLNNVQHKDLRIIATAGARYGDDVMAVMTFPAEFREIQAHYPIVFTKTRDGDFIPLALFGFREKQNLFLDGDRWDGTYVPLMLTRQPFLIGTDQNNQSMVHIDLDHPRVSRTEGELLFKEFGGTTEFLDRMTDRLAVIHQGLPATKPFVTALNEHGLLESFALDIEFRDGAQHRFAGFYTVREEKLAELKGDVLADFHARGYLQAVYMVIASLSQFRALIERASKLDAASR